MSELVTGQATHCPWCSAELPPGTAGTCPSCGATLTSSEGPEPDIRGVTTLDPEAILRARSESSRPRSRLLSFITGDAGDQAVDPAAAASVALPDIEVRREMLRLQIEAERAELEAESVALRTDAIVEQGIDLASLTDEGEPAPDAPAGDSTAIPPAPPPAGTAPTPASPPPPPDQPPPPPPRP
jgi:hypothetical protein